MDWTIGYVGVGVVLNALLLHVWKPWAGAYAGEKAKNFARKEDLEAILAEVRAVTITQKTIESKLSGDLWDRQMHWNQKRDLYAELIKLTRDLTMYYTNISATRSLPLSQQELLLEQHKDVLVQLATAQSEFGHLVALANIFANEKCTEALYKYGKVNTPIEMTIESVAQHISDTGTLIAELVVAAREDLGIPNRLP